VYKCLGWLWAFALLASGAVGAAEKPPDKPGVARDADKAKKPPKPPPGFTPEREAAAVEFVRRHHPELAALLAELKKTEAAEYHRAVSALFRASERLAHVQERNPETYERELNAWKLSSRIQLLVAQIKMAPEDEKLRRELAAALSEQLDVRCARLVEERDKLRDRLDKLEGQIQEIQQQRETLVEKQLEVLFRDKKKHGVQDSKVPRSTNPPTKPAH
jgi:hypothetical protein